MSEPSRLPLAAVVLASLTLIAVVVDMTLLTGNQTLEADVQHRQQFINQSVQVNQVGNALMQALGTAAVNANDTAARDLLSQYGINVSTSGAPQAPKSP